MESSSKVHHKERILKLKTIYMNCTNVTQKLYIKYFWVKVQYAGENNGGSHYQLYRK